MRKYIGGGGGVARQAKAESTEFQMHYLGNPSFMRAAVEPSAHLIPATATPTEVASGEDVWTMPSGAAAYRAALVIASGEDVARRLTELGGIRK
jgi:hypothetical protein